MEEYKFNNYITALSSNGDILHCYTCNTQFYEVKIDYFNSKTTTAFATCPGCSCILAFNIESKNDLCKVIYAIELYL